MSDKVIETIPFQAPDQALFETLEYFRAAIERRERVDKWIDWEREQHYGLGERGSGPQSIKRMLARQVDTWEGEGGR